MAQEKPKDIIKYKGLTFETSDSDFRDLLDELFHMAEQFVSKKIKINFLILKIHEKLKNSKK